LIAVCRSLNLKIPLLFSSAVSCTVTLAERILIFLLLLRRAILCVLVWAFDSCSLVMMSVLIESWGEHSEERESWVSKTMIGLGEVGWFAIAFSTSQLCLLVELSSSPIKRPLAVRLPFPWFTSLSYGWNIMISGKRVSIDKDVLYISLSQCW
jgi:hypothetical protein